MKRITIFALAAFAAVFSGTQSLQAGISPSGNANSGETVSISRRGEEEISTDEVKVKDKAKSKSRLARENAEFAARIDSLERELALVRQEMASRDSLAEEFIDIYEGSSRSELGYDSDLADSLLNIWHLHRSLQEDPVEQFDMDSARFSSNVPDSVYISRIREMNSFITLPYNDIVRNYIILYSEKMPEKMGAILGLGRYYMPMFEEILDRYGLPLELKAMAVIESALNPVAVSRAGAKGMWQFMYGTARHYGLTIDSFVDERFDPVASADAAARYLLDAYNIFGDWCLAIASYNCGAGNVNRAIRRSGGKTAFWDIYPYLPRETRGYVPAFVGALYAMKYYKEHGIEPANPTLPLAVDTFKIHKMLHFKQVSELVGIPVEELRNLNPQYRHDIVPGDGKDYTLTIPFSYVNAFVDVEDSLYTYKADEFFNPVNIKKIKDGGDGQRIVYRVRSGDSLGKIAARYRVSVNQIKNWNNLRGTMIRVGQRLVIYSGVAYSDNSSSGASASSASGASASGKSSIDPNTPYITYVVKSGDNLYDIAKKFPGVSAQNIMDFNGISSRIKPGMTIKIPQL